MGEFEPLQLPTITFTLAVCALAAANVATPTPPLLLIITAAVVLIVRL